MEWNQDSADRPGELLRPLTRSCFLPPLLKRLFLLAFPVLLGICLQSHLFRLASLLALLVGLNLSFLTGALLWSFKITKAATFESVKVFRKDPFLALYISLSSLMIFRPLCLLPSAALFTLTIWPFGPLPHRFPLRWRPHKELCFDWSAGVSAGVFLSIRANVRPRYFQWIPTKLTSNPTSSYSAPASVSIQLQLFLGSPSTALFPFLSMYLRWRPGFSHVSRPYAVPLHPHGAHLRSPFSVLYKSFLRSLLTYASPGWFPFLSATNLTRLERLYRAASRAITGFLSSSPIPLLLFEASLPPLRVTLTHFTLLSYERALRLPTSFSISGLTRLEVKPRLCRSSWRAFASTHPLLLPSTCSREALLSCPPCPPSNLPSFTVESTLSTPCSRSEPPHSRQGAALAHLDSLPPHDLVLWTDGSVPFLLGKGGSGVLANCSLCGTEATLSFSAGPVCSSFSAEACAIVHALCWSRQHHKVCHFSSLLLLSDSRSVLATLFSPPSFLLSQTLWQIWQELSSLSSCYIRLQWVPGHSFLPGNDRRGALLAPSAIPCSLSPLTSRIHSRLFSDWRRTVSSKYLDTQVPSISTEELVFPSHACCVLSRLRCNGHSLLLSSYLSRIGRIENSSCSACGHPSQDISYLFLHCPATNSLRRSLFGDSLSLYDLWSRPWGVARLLGLHGIPPCPIPRKGSGNQQQQQNGF